MKTYQEQHNTYQPYLLLDQNFSYEKDVEKDDLSRTVLELMEKINLANFIDFNEVDTRSKDPKKMLSLIVLGHVLYGSPSLRKLEEMTQYDSRFWVISQREKISYRTFGRFINEVLKVNCDELMKQINEIILSEEKLEKTILMIDGTKYEANANKMSFVWRGWLKRYKPNHWKKWMELLNQVNRYFKKVGIDVKYSILKEPNMDYVLEVDERLEAWMKEKGVLRKGRGKHEIAKCCDEMKKVAIKLCEYELIQDILSERNSFSKVDPDATFMHMKYDYYNHTNVFKPGYNIQFAVSAGYIQTIYISSDGNDIKTLIPTLEKYKKIYGRYPEVVVADAGYGSYENYSYGENKGIEMILKYSGYEKKKEKLNEKNQFRSDQMKRTADGTPICPAGNEFELEETQLQFKGIYPQTVRKYRNHHCEGCALRSKCTKSTIGRTVQYSPEYEKQKQRIDEYLQTEQGKGYMRMRSSQAEGAFGVLKQDQGYDRMKRRGESGVKVEMTMAAIGFNIRKYHNKKAEKSKAISKMN